MELEEYYNFKQIVYVEGLLKQLINYSGRDMEYIHAL